MERVLYTEETITSMPNSTFIHEHIQDLRETVDRLEAEREEILLLLYEIVDAEGLDELDEIILKIKTFVENTPYPAPY